MASEDADGVAEERGQAPKERELASEKGDVSRVIGTIFRAEEEDLLSARYALKISDELESVHPVGRVVVESIGLRERMADEGEGAGGIDEIRAGGGIGEPSGSNRGADVALGSVEIVFDVDGSVSI